GVATLNTGLGLLLLGLSLFSCGHEESRSKQDRNHNETLGRHAWHPRRPSTGCARLISSKYKYLPVAS
uniref:Uncharacterized protein n=1 Tax=Aegilops tauschii subsp. strangulata TaxID=200361 RepID=A0A453MSZ6_AEGTS